MDLKNIKTWVLRGITATIIVMAVVILLFSILFYSWRSNLHEKAQPAGSVINIENGFVEYHFDDRGGDEVVFYSHGTPANFLAPAPNPFADFGYSMLSVARPGYFNTMLSTGRTPADQADLYAKVIERLEMDSVIMWGVSGGGPAAMEFALNYPEKCRALILQASYFQQNGNLNSSGWLKESLESEFGYWLRLNTRKIFSETQQERENIENYLQSIVPYPLIKNGLENDRIQLSAYAKPDLSLIDCPILIIHGSKDKKIPVTEVEELIKRNDKIAYFQFEGGNHYATLFSNDEIITSEIQSFLNNSLD